MEKIFLAAALAIAFMPISPSWGSPNRAVEESEETMRSAITVLHDTHIPGAKKASCTATLISSDIAITAAHCVVKILEITPMVRLSKEPAEPQDISLKFGNWSEEGTPSASTQRGASQIIVHPRFNNERVGNDPINDIAIVKMDRPAPANFTPARILGNSIRLVPGAPILVAGFGNNLPPFTLSSFETTIESNQYSNLGAIGIRIGEDEKEGTVFKGYSGGPAYLAIGGELVAWGVCNGGWMGVMTYQSIPFYLNWIEESIQRTLGDARLNVVD